MVPNGGGSSAALVDTSAAKAISSILLRVMSSPV
jgi:hypothetical protein